MIGETLTIENLAAIKMAMDKIAKIDQSEFFENYYKEVNERIAVLGDANQPYFAEDRTRSEALFSLTRLV